MDNAKKRQIKKYISWISLAALVALLAAMPLLAGSEPEEDGPQASILSGTIQSGSIDAVLHGGGVLSYPERAKINLPAGVKLREFLVSNGQFVTEGTPLALVDRVSIMTAITQVQETMDYLVEQMNEFSQEEASDTISAQAGGRVKQVFAREGETVQEVMLRDGALAVLSLDGRMAVRLPSSSTLDAGNRVNVLLSDGTPVDGRIESNLDGIMTVTIEDEGYAVGDAVTVTTAGGEFIGTGSLYIHNAWHAVAYTGVIDRIRIEPDQTVDAGDTLFRLSDTSYTARRETLARQHGEYQDLMLRLFRMYQSETIDAPCDGVVSGIDEDSIHLLSGDGSGIVLELLANAPNGDDETSYLNFSCLVTGANAGGWEISLNIIPQFITDYRDLSGILLDPSLMVYPATFAPTVPVYELNGGQWTQIDLSAVRPGDYLLISMDLSGNFVWVVRINEENRTPAQPAPSVPEAEPTIPNFPAVPGLPTVPEDGGADPTIPPEWLEGLLPSIPSGDPTIPTYPGGQYPNIQLPEGYEDYLNGYGGYGDFSGFGELPGEPEFELFDLDGSTLMTVTEQETITLEIMLDQQDIAQVTLGQAARVRVEAIQDQVFPATVTAIGSKGSNSGGSSKFTVELTLDKTEEMLAGMSATATIPLSASEELPVIPLAALVEQGADTVVYTGYDEKNDVLTGPVTVTVGMSDDAVAQILSGLRVGDTYYYAYYDTLELSTEVDTQRSPFG